LPITSDEGDEYINSLYNYILDTISRFDDAKQAFPISSMMKALYTCVFLADELFKKQEEISKMQEEFIRETEKKDDEIALHKKYLEEFIAAFDTDINVSMGIEDLRKKIEIEEREEDEENEEN